MTNAVQTVNHRNARMKDKRSFAFAQDSAPRMARQGCDGNLNEIRNILNNYASQGRRRGRRRKSRGLPKDEKSSTH